MLPGEQGPPEEILSYHSNIVNHVIQFAGKEADAYLANRVRRLIRTLQLRWYRRSQQQIYCPTCGVNEHTRKGWRPRVLRSSRGRLVLLVIQAKCKRCGRAFRPFTTALPHEDRGVYQSRLKDILFGEWRMAPRILGAFIKNLEAADCITSAEHLRDARSETFTYRTDRNFTYATTTPTEREMRELRRADVIAP